jgi:hypothetical protein
LRFNIAGWYEDAQQPQKALQVMRENLVDMQTPSPCRVGPVAGTLRDTKLHLITELLHLQEYDEAFLLGHEVLQDPTMDDNRIVETLYSLGIAYTTADQQNNALLTLDRLTKISLRDSSNTQLLRNRIDLLRSNMKASGVLVPTRPQTDGPSTACCDE